MTGIHSKGHSRRALFFTLDQLSLSKGSKGCRKKSQISRKGVKKTISKSLPQRENNHLHGTKLQHFLTGLRPKITKQILLQGAPGDIAEAIKTAISVECALSFANGPAVHEQSSTQLM